MDCLAWGVFGARRCSSCNVLRHCYPGSEGECAGCSRTIALKRGYCRLCWQQAAFESKAAGGLPRGAVSVLASGERLPFQQLFFDRMKRRRPDSPAHQRGWRSRPKPPPPPAVRPAERWVQLRLFQARRDFTRFEESTDADLANPWLNWALYLAYRRGEARGWRRGVRFAVQRALIILLSRHTSLDVIYYSEVFPALRALDLTVERTVEVLQEMGVFVDDRPSAFDGWLEAKLEGLTPGIRDDVEAWARALHGGAPRIKPRNIKSVWIQVNRLRPTLLHWSDRYDHLREVTREDLAAVLNGLQGSHRSNFLVAARSLFAFCRKRRSIFRNPTRGVRIGQHPYGLVQRLDQDDIDRATEAATTPAARLVLMLAAVHAARTGAIRSLLLDDVDLGNRRLTIAGRTRPIDEFTHQILLEWLDYRRTRWPNTANPHLLINQLSALGTGPVSKIYFAKKLRGQAATLERLRVDRQLEEALTHGPDPLHLAAVFGLDPKTAIRYAENARVLLATAAEEQDPARRDEP
ncbi:hypothetical protein SAMN05444920_1721, partial [Nonomuraea solani]